MTVFNETIPIIPEVQIISALTNIVNFGLRNVIKNKTLNFPVN